MGYMISNAIADFGAAHPWLRGVYAYVLVILFIGALFAAGNPNRDD